MNEHQMTEIQPRPEIGKAHDRWHEVGCSCGWSSSQSIRSSAKARVCASS